MEEFHILEEQPVNSGTFVETGEIITTNETDAKLRCVELSQGGSRFGMYVYESVIAMNVLPPGGTGLADAGTTLGTQQLPGVRPGGGDKPPEQPKPSA